MLSMRGWVREGVRIPEEYAECDRIVTCRVRPRKDELQESWIIIARQEVYLAAIADGLPQICLSRLRLAFTVSGHGAGAT